MAFDITVTTADITINSGTGDLDDLVAAVDDTAIMEEVAGVYTIKGDRGLKMDGGELTIDSSYEDGSLIFLNTVNYNYVLLTNGGKFNCTAPGFLIDVGYNNDLAYIGLYSDITLNGTEAKPIVIKHFYKHYIRPYGQTIDYNHVLFTDLRDYYMTAVFAFQNYSTNSRLNVSGMSFRNIEVDTNACGVIWIACNFDFSNTIFDGFVLKNITGGYIIRKDAGSSIKMTNCDFSQISKSVSVFGNGDTSFYYPGVNKESNDNRYKMQPKDVFENCKFGKISCSGVSCSYKYKNCEFGDPSFTSYALYGDANAHLFEGGQSAQTWDSGLTNNVVYSTSYGPYFDCYSLDLTVEDSNGGAIENATVTIFQVEGKENWSFVTDSNGTISDMYGDLPVFVHRENHTNSSTFDNWSDSISEGRYHLMAINKPGYQTWTRQIEFSENKVVVAQLTEETIPENTTIINGTTLIDSQIY
jgi:hypothetical protein